MTVVTQQEAAEQFLRLVDLVEAGEEVVIEVDGKHAVRMVRVDSAATTPDRDGSGA